jgi:hypothetical protein
VSQRPATVLFRVEDMWQRAGLVGPGNRQAGTAPEGCIWFRVRLVSLQLPFLLRANIDFGTIRR